MRWMSDWLLAGFSRADAEMRVLLGMNTCSGVWWEGSVRAPSEPDGVSASTLGSSKAEGPIGGLALGGGGQACVPLPFQSLAGGLLKKSMTLAIIAWHSCWLGAPQEQQGLGLKAEADSKRGNSQWLSRFLSLQLGS